MHDEFWSILHMQMGVDNTAQPNLDLIMKLKNSLNFLDVDGVRQQ